MNIGFTSQECKISETRPEINIAIIKALHLFERRLLHHPAIPTSAFSAITAVREQLTDQLPIGTSSANVHNPATMHSIGRNA